MGLPLTGLSRRPACGLVTPLTSLSAIYPFHGLSAVLAVTPDNESSAQVRILTGLRPTQPLWSNFTYTPGPSPGNVVISISSNFSLTLQMLISANVGNYFCDVHTFSHFDTVHISVEICTYGNISFIKSFKTFYWG